LFVCHLQLQGGYLTYEGQPSVKVSLFQVNVQGIVLQIENYKRNAHNVISVKTR